MTRLIVLVSAMLTSLALAAPSAAWALTADEVIRLKKAGVSDETIQKMVEQEKRGGGQQGPVSETRDEVIYRAGPTNEEIEAQERRERRKEDKAMDGVGNVIIDRRGGRAPAGGPSGAGAGN